MEVTDVMRQAAIFQGLSDEEIKNISQIYIVACGSAWHVGMATQYVMEDLAKIPVRVELASEFRYRKPLLDKNAFYCKCGWKQYRERGGSCFLYSGRT